MSAASKTVKLPYGQSFLKAVLPARNVIGVFASEDVPGLEDESAAILHALRNPVGSEPLLDRLQVTDTVAVIVTDNTRPCPDDRIAPVLLAELERKVPRGNITIVIALGLHPALTDDELAAKLGRDVVEKYRVLNHDPADTVAFGETSRGIPVEVNRTVAEADFRVSTGFIEPHFFAGFSGGRKSIAPGVSSQRAIRANHSFAMIEHLHARTGILSGNPIHEDMVEQARLARLDFIINVLLNRKNEITHVVAGDVVLAHEEGCRLARETTGVPVQTADIVIATNSGAPLDLDFYQTCKGIDTAARFCRRGGIIIMAAACDKGVGPASFCELHAAAGAPRDVLEAMGRSDPGGTCWQNQILARAQLDHDIYLVSELDDASVRQMMVEPVPSVEQGLEKAFAALGPDATIAVIPEGPRVLPVEP